MSELTKEQLDKAAQIYRSAYVNADPAGADEGSRRVALKAAAPFLQLPWEMPTPSEGVQASWDGAKVSAAFQWDAVLAKFVQRRNAALLPKVDERREKIIKVLQCETLKASYADLADCILAALDKEKP